MEKDLNKGEPLVLVRNSECSPFIVEYEDGRKEPCGYELVGDDFILKLPSGGRISKISYVAPMTQEATVTIRDGRDREQPDQDLERRTKPFRDLAKELEDEALIRIQMRNSSDPRDLTTRDFLSGEAFGYKHAAARLKEILKVIDG